MSKNRYTWGPELRKMLCERFRYNEHTGILHRLDRYGCWSDVPQTPSKSNGYLWVSLSSGGIVINTTQHRMIWFMLHGELPPHIDHINGDRTDNRLCNLRAATRSLNGLNRHTKVGVDQDLPVGVYRRERKGRKGLWYECKVQSRGTIKSTYKRHLSDAKEYVRKAREELISAEEAKIESAKA